LRLALLITNEVCLFFNRLKSLRYGEGDFERKCRELPEHSLCANWLSCDLLDTMNNFAQRQKMAECFIEGFGLRFGERVSYFTVG